MFDTAQKEIMDLLLQNRVLNAFLASPYASRMQSYFRPFKVAPLQQRRHADTAEGVLFIFF